MAFRPALSQPPSTGPFAFNWPGRAYVRGVTWSVRFVDGTELSPKDYQQNGRTWTSSDHVTDGLGPGKLLTYHYAAEGKPEAQYHIRSFNGKTFSLVSLTVTSDHPLASNHLELLKAEGGARLEGGGAVRGLFVPFDNDDYVRFNSGTVSESYEVSALYDNAGRHGIVVGSVDHDTWKTAVQMRNYDAHGVGSLTVLAGATGRWTHDKDPHGIVRDATLVSPRVMVGFFTDWRRGMETYAQINAAIHRPLRWSGGVPFGWNSWYALGKNVHFDDYVHASDTFKQDLQAKGFENHGTVYVNWDSFWDNEGEQRLIEAARHAHANGQKAGIYWTPFASWVGDLSRPVEGTEGKYTYGDIVLKLKDGGLARGMDPGKALDPTHPGTLARIDYFCRKFVEWGYDFVKLDFTSYGALEGEHHNPAVPTGIGAYNLGMRRLVADLAPSRIGRPFFISLSIAPLFPAGYAHARRISCDAAGSLGSSEYMLNAVTYGWWSNGTIYRYNDPDLIVLKNSEQEARTRINASAIAGTVMLDSDDLSNPEVRARAERYLTNPDIVALARAGRTFRPVDADTGERSTTVYMRQDPAGRVYVALFNFDKQHEEDRTVSLERLGLSRDAAYQVRDLWSGHTERVQRILHLRLAPAESTIMRLTPE